MVVTPRESEKKLSFYRQNFIPRIAELKAIFLPTGRGKEGEMKTISEQMEEIKQIMCDKYCKFPYLWDEEKEGQELCESELCENCPLNRL